MVKRDVVSQNSTSAIILRNYRIVRFGIIRNGKVPRGELFRMPNYRGVVTGPILAHVVGSPRGTTINQIASPFLAFSENSVVDRLKPEHLERYPRLS